MSVCSALSMAHREITTRTVLSQVGSAEEDDPCINEVCSDFVILEDPLPFKCINQHIFSSFFLARADVLFAVLQKKALSLALGNCN